MLLSISRVVPTTTAVKWLCCKLLAEIVDDDNSKEDTEVTADVPCSVIRFELIVATDDESLLDRALEGTTDVDTRTDDVTSTDEISVKGVIVCLFAMPALSASNCLWPKYLIENLLGMTSTEKTMGVQRLYFGLPHLNSLIHPKHPSTCSLYDLMINNTEADVINTKVAVIKFNRRSF